MKSKFNKIIALIVIINIQFSIFNSYSQTIPAGVNFQAIARGATGGVLVSTAIQVRVSILDGSSSGSVLGSYTYQKTTDAYGQFTVAIGTDATIANSGATLSAIDWTAAARWIKVEYQPGTSGGFTLISNSEATASFYSFAAKTAAGLKIAGTSGQVLKHNGTTWVAGTDNSGGFLPEGMISPYGGTSAPTGWLMCEGSAVSRTTYATLFAAIGTAFGSGDGSTTFNLPDFRGRFMRGVDGTANNDPEYSLRTASNTGGNTGNAVGSYQSDDLKSHNHNIRRDNNSGSQAVGIESPSHGAGFDDYAITENAGGYETRPKNVYVNYIIKY